MTKLYDLSGKEVGNVSLPAVFSTSYRPDVIKRAVLSIQSFNRHPYGSDPLAGKKTSAHYHGRRKYRYSMMNKEMSRIPRIHGNVGHLVWRARFAPHAVKGRRAHPPKPEKIWAEGINKKENLLAIKSALAACSDIELIKKRGHKTEIAPLIFVDDIEKIKKSKEMMKLLEKIIPKEIERCMIKKVRAGVGKTRGRKYVKKKGILFVSSNKCDALKAVKNIAGSDAVAVGNLNAALLAPGTHAGRLLVLSQSSLKKIEERFK